MVVVMSVCARGRVCVAGGAGTGVVVYAGVCYRHLCGGGGGGLV